MSIASLEPRTGARLDAGTAVLIFACQAAVILPAAFVACRTCSLKPVRFGFSRDNIPARIGVPLLALLTVVPLPGFLRTGLDPVAGANFAFLPLNSIQAFIGYELAYFLFFFFRVEVLFRSFLFLGTAAVMAPAASDNSEPAPPPWSLPARSPVCTKSFSIWASRCPS